ncbi:MAG: adenylyltransferase/cytidyltransferase family protein [Sulfurimonas sp.]|nr:adenylyltransferase/cytidyltransferase family protein [Sulfurimonas sp.]
MKKIITIDELGTIVKTLKLEEKKIVLVGGCFDIVHIGHLAFLQKAKEQGNFLIVLLESDESIRKMKGNTRPIHTQKLRAKILGSLDSVDFVVQLPQLTTDAEYSKLVKIIEPDIIAVTKGDPILSKKKAHARAIHAQVIEVIERQQEHSTSNLIKEMK